MELVPLVIAALAVFVGAYARGFSGFGSGMIWAGGLSLVLPPVVVVPAIFLLDLVASAHLVPRVWKDIDWRSLFWLLLGTLVATAPGLYLLTELPANVTRAAIAVVILAMTLLLWRGFTLKAMPGPGMAGATGVLSGLLAGATGMGGPPAILLYFSAPTAVGISRASIIGFLFGLDVISGGLAAVQGLYTREVVVWSLALALPISPASSSATGSSDAPTRRAFAASCSCCWPPCRLPFCCGRFWARVRRVTPFDHEGSLKPC